MMLDLSYLGTTLLLFIRDLKGGGEEGNCDGPRPYSIARPYTCCRVERSLLWEITGSLAAADNDLRVGKQLLFSKPKIVVKQTVFNHTHTKDLRPTNSIQR